MLGSTSYRKLLKEVATLFFFVVIYFVAGAQNAIVTENSQTGNPSSEWDISGAGDLGIQGFATEVSVNKGETVHFKIKTNASSYTIKIYRLGYYQGNGARFMGDGIITATLPQIQPADLYDVTTGKTDCSNWAESAHWDVPSNAVSGIYIAKLTRSTGSSHIVFIVRDDASTSNLLFKTSDATWQAYNNYGGNSLYVNRSGIAVPGFNHATKVSYNRPFLTRNGGGGGGPAEDWLFNAEYPMIRWLERNGYDVTYTTDVDMSRSITAITPANHKVLMSVGHDEYWSATERTNFENARSTGVHLAFFSGNEVYWKVRWEDNFRTLVCYKEGTEGENVCNGECDPSNEWTGLWRTGCGATGANDGCRPENALSGQISWEDVVGGIQVPETYKNLRFWRNTSIASLSTGQVRVLPDGTLGYEWDWEQAAYASSYPPGRILMSSTTLDGKTHKLSLYRHSSGALVFGAGTVQWSWGLDDNHDRSGTPISTDMQQATVNLFADMGVQPATLQTGLVPATASTDNQAPVTTINSPVQGATVNNGSTITITGTATDAGGVVAGVEVSVNGGTTWQVATGTTNWSFTWTPSTSGSVTIKSRGFDDTGNMETAGTAPASNAVAITVGGTTTCPCTIFQPTSTPANTGNDNQPIELGVKFQTTTNGYITGIRFYKAAGDNGTHIGHLWSSNGTSLGQATFTAESGSGWQQVNFGSPVAVTANTTYIASYHSSANFYTYTDNFFTTAIQNGPLKALANGEDGPNGVYIYSPAPAFPTQTFQSSNYWVDVVFETSVGPDVTAPSVSSTSPANNAVSVNANANINATFNEAIDASTINSTNFELRNGSTVIPASVTYNAGSQTAVLDPSSPLSYLTSYTATIKGGSSGVKDAAGNALVNDFTWSFTTQSQPITPPQFTDPNNGPGGPVLIISSASNPFSRYAVEILRAEGLNEFAAADISTVSATTLDSYDVVVLGEIPLNAAQVTLLTDWVNAGGTLIAFKPNALLYPLLGITSAGGTLSDRYLLVNTSNGPGAGIVGQTIQFHGTADLYTLNGATSIATLYSNTTTATTNPAVTIMNVGSNGGKAVAFAYDLARSIIYTRQGNPAWAGQKRDGQDGPIRSDDMFFPDWIDFNKVAIPQADEQQRLLTNIIIQSNLHRKPLPRFWFLPRKLKAAVVMTGDDHGNNGTTGRFNQYLSLSPDNSPQAVADWRAIRGTSYIYPNTPITNEQAVAFEAQGFEISLHLNTGCANYTPASLENDFTTQLAAFASEFPGISPPSTHRTHCIAWSDWATKPKVEFTKGIRLNTDYYYWPAAWIQNRPGMFTGSGMPMRFADLDGTIIDNYQVTTQLTDESGITYTNHISQLLDKAIGAEGYYGVFCANMHTDVNGSNSTIGSNAIIEAAQSRQIPVISARQMLTWLDGRNASSFGSLAWTNNSLNFTISVASGANQLQAMLPVISGSGQLSGITLNGAAVTYTTELIKGINYAFFDANNGNYAASYSATAVLPVISTVTATPGSNGTATITWTTDGPSSSRVDYGTTADNLNLNQNNTALVTNHSITLTGLTAGTIYYFRVTSTDGSANSTTEPNPSTAPLSFRALAFCAADQTLADFNSGTFDGNTSPALEDDGEVILKPVLIEEFSGTTVPAGWTAENFSGSGTTTINNGSVTVNGSHLFSNNSFGPGSSIEFTATYSQAAFQNIGFSADQPFNANPWITIGQGGSPDGNLYARASDNTSISLGPLLGSPHRFIIKWNANNFEFYVDGNPTPAATIPMTVTQNMFIQISDVATTDGMLSVDWLRVTPYSSSGSFTSRVFDAGASTNWGIVSWTATMPTGTALQVFVRTGNTAIPDGTWSDFTAITNGGNIGVSSRYLQYRADLSTTDTKYTPTLKDIGIECSVGADVTAPVITNIAAVSASDGVSATITWTTNENANSRVDFGTSASALAQNVSDATLVTSHSLQLTGLAPGTTYYYRVTSADAAGNSATSPETPAAPLSFVTLAPSCFDDVTLADFSGGTTGTGTYISVTGDGEVILKPAAGSEFNSLPPATEWNSYPWVTGGSATVSNGSLNVNGARFNSEPEGTTFGPGNSLEFVATFGATNFQHIGFGGGSDATDANGIFTGQSPWAMFSTGNTTNTLLARTFVPGGGTSDFIIPNSSALLGTPHKYRIEWKTNGSFEYFVDDVSVRVEPVTITSGMRPAISDFNAAAPAITVDWIRVTPYATNGTFESRIFDAGEIRSWGAATWNADIPTGAGLQLLQRQGNTPVPDGTWTSYIPIGTNGQVIGGMSQYIQYRADLSTTNNAVSPVLRDVHFSCTPTTVLIGQADLQGRPSSPNAQWQIPVVVSLYSGTTLVNTYNVTTDQNGRFTIAGITPGTYTVTVKGFNTLRRVLLNQTLSAGTNNINTGLLRAGDANGDNFVGGADFSILINSYNKQMGDPGYDARADFNGDGFVTGADFSLLVNAYNQLGEEP